MDELDELIEKLNNLPKGYISEKLIKSRKYFYLQRKENSKIISKYIKKENVEEIRKQLIERERYEKILDEFINKGEPLANLNKNSNELTGFVMSGNLIVAKVKNNEIIWADTKRCPLLLTHCKFLTPFLKKRAIDESRVNSRLLKKAMNIKNDQVQEKLPLYVHGAVITDNFWFRPSGSRLVYEDIKFKYDNYAELSLKGDTRFNSNKSKKNPQITLVGSYEKCWKLIDNEWWLYKVGTKEEIFSEIFCSKLAELINIPTAYYEKDAEFIRSRNFTDFANFEPMSSLAGEDDSYENVFKVCLNLSEEIAKQYLSLMYFDALVENADRHNENLGFLRNKRTGSILSLAPNFDNNVSLISRSKILNEDRINYGLIKAFAQFLKSNVKAMELFRSLEMVEIDEKLIDECFRKTQIDFYSENIKRFILNGYHYLESIRREKRKK